MLRYLEFQTGVVNLFHYQARLASPIRLDSGRGSHVKTTYESHPPIRRMVFICGARLGLGRESEADFAELEVGFVFFTARVNCCFA